jgi:hypothetical protein
MLPFGPTRARLGPQLGCPDFINDLLGHIPADAVLDVIVGHVLHCLEYALKPRGVIHRPAIPVPQLRGLPGAVPTPDPHLSFSDRHVPALRLGSQFFSTYLEVFDLPSKQALVRGYVLVVVFVGHWERPPLGMLA